MTRAIHSASQTRRSSRRPGLDTRRLYAPLFWDARVDTPTAKDDAAEPGSKTIATAEASTKERSEPFFIVGCPRSGTTLLRLMVDGHSNLAVPPESHFVVPLAYPRRLRPLLRPVVVEDILPYLSARDWEVDHDEVRSAVARAAPLSYAELVSAVFGAYAAAQGKPRWGDKTPRYVDHLPTIAELFPNARFIHLIRDGREVAASLAERRWGPQSAVLGAFVWRRAIRRARAAGRMLGGRYMELRYEGLVTDTEAQLRRICEFLGEDYEAGMLAYASRDPADRAAKSTGFRHLTSPPIAGLRDWTAGLTSLERRGVEAVCRDVLVELGYPPPAASHAGSAYAWGSLSLRVPMIAVAGTAAAVTIYAPRLSVVGEPLSGAGRRARRGFRRLRRGLARARAG